MYSFRKDQPDTNHSSVERDKSEIGHEAATSASFRVLCPEIGPDRSVHIISSVYWYTCKVRGSIL